VTEDNVLEFGEKCWIVEIAYAEPALVFVRGTLLRDGVIQLVEGVRQGLDTRGHRTRAVSDLAFEVCGLDQAWAEELCATKIETTVETDAGRIYICPAMRCYEGVWRVTREDRALEVINELLGTASIEDVEAIIEYWKTTYPRA